MLTEQPNDQSYCQHEYTKEYTNKSTKAKHKTMKHTPDNTNNDNNNSTGYFIQTAGHITQKQTVLLYLFAARLWGQAANSSRVTPSQDEPL